MIFGRIENHSSQSCRTPCRAGNCASMHPNCIPTYLLELKKLKKWEMFSPTVAKLSRRNGKTLLIEKKIHFIPEIFIGDSNDFLRAATLSNLCNISKNDRNLTWTSIFFSYYRLFVKIYLEKVEIIYAYIFAVNYN